ncbi:hypothetical protein M514_26758 [Trichuris suis]|uniref:Uncharacterized protein n=1 Tax=Trichuris suis TaxID=68888 RepID=A0A085MV10_9BILA|nr:hypothetical protein M514_26758 [Trichuris suis]
MKIASGICPSRSLFIMHSSNATNESGARAASSLSLAFLRTPWLPGAIWSWTPNATPVTREPITQTSLISQNRHADSAFRMDAAAAAAREEPPDAGIILTSVIANGVFWDPSEGPDSL